jgi:hypothetical protein
MTNPMGQSPIRQPQTNLARSESPCRPGQPSREPVCYAGIPRIKPGQHRLSAAFVPRFSMLKCGYE